MIVQESTRTRSIVGQLDSGDECVSTLTDFCDEHDIQAAQIRAIGRLDRAEVVRFEEDTGDYEPVFEGEATFDVVQLNGNISTLGNQIVARLETVLSTEGPAGPQVITGQLRSGRVVELEFTLEVFDDLEFERQLDQKTGRLALNAIRREEPESSSDESEQAPATDDDPETVDGKAMTWGDVANEEPQSAEAPSSSQPRPDDARPSSSPGPSPTSTSSPEDDEQDVEDIYGDMDLDSPMIEAGDILDHPDLGRCRVIKVEEDEYIHVRTPQRGRMRKLSLNVVDVAFNREENGRQVFDVEV